MTTNAVLEVDRARCGETRLVESELEPLGRRARSGCGSIASP